MVLQGHTKDVLVLSYPIQSIVRRTSTSEVEGLLRAVAYRNEVATNINILEVDQLVADGIMFRAIQAILERMPNITPFILQLLFRCFRVFPRVTVFENLIDLKGHFTKGHGVWSVLQGKFQGGTSREFLKRIEEGSGEIWSKPTVQIALGTEGYKKSSLGLLAANKPDLYSATRDI
ncbi:hypothetical protein EDB85DRAFT_1893530 [Lactarius pseudohatsudake]|nr:hypothetical protein EDB85DRAFT_1893530 [Lactarius pseudohatsudake]